MMTVLIVIQTEYLFIVCVLLLQLWYYYYELVLLLCAKGSAVFFTRTLPRNRRAYAAAPAA